MNPPNDKDIELVPDTGEQENLSAHPSDPQNVNGGGSSAPGGDRSPDRESDELTHGQETYPGPRTGGEMAHNNHGPAQE
jgi:hypothetical protein